MTLCYILIMESKRVSPELMNLTQEELITIILELRETNARLEKRIQQLEAQRHKDSHNSSTPPSQSPHLPIKNLREKTEKSRGGQPGHLGHTLQMVTTPTHTIRYKVTRCELCGKDLFHTPAAGYERRQVFDIPAIVCEVTEHEAEKKRCACGHMTTASFPETVSAPVQYGIQTQTLVSTLLTHGYLSYNRVSELTEYLIGHRVNESTVCSIQDKLNRKLEYFEEKSKLHLSQSEVIHNDETGIPIEGKQQWLHVSASKEITHYAVDVKRGKEATDRIGILPSFQGITVHDGWKAYFQYEGCQHGLCNAHHLRELTFFEEEEKAVWAGFLKDLLLSAKASVEKAKQTGQASLNIPSLQEIDNRYDEILGGASLMQPTLRGKKGKLKKTEQQTFIARLLKYKRNVLTFIYDFRVPFDNNLAERDIRMMKLKGKISGTFRSLYGAQCFARIRGYISTVQKNDRNVFKEIKNALGGRPFLLPEWYQSINC